jgi:transcription elongation factor GreA
MSKDPGQDTITLTQSGLLELQQELKTLREVQMPKVVERIATAREQGDLSENADYHSARNEQEILQARIDEIEEILAKATIVDDVPANSKKSSRVQMGSTVVLSLVGKDRKVTYSLGGQYESTPAEGKISVESPVGKALLGKSKGDKVTVEVPAGKMEYLILEIK